MGTTCGSILFRWEDVGEPCSERRQKPAFPSTRRLAILERKSTADAVMRREVTCVLRRVVGSQKPREAGQAKRTTGLKLTDTSTDHILFSLLHLRVDRINE